jgi:dTDP-4-dehydrorhamnose 3,5-epimerase
MPMDFVPTPLEGVFEIHAKHLPDDRGDFVKIFHAPLYHLMAPQLAIREIYYSRSKRGAIRGLHYQIPPFAMDKIIFCLKGAVYEACVDLRPSSPTLGKSFAVELNEDNGKGIFIPKGFAAGLQALSDDATIISGASEIYAPEHERGIAWDSCGIAWRADTPIVSPKDRAQPRLQDHLAAIQ